MTRTRLYIFITIFLIAALMQGILLFLHFSETQNDISVTYSECSEKEKSQKIRCWETTTEDMLRKNEISYILDQLVVLYESDSDFPPTCHAFTHKIGEDAYKQFVIKKDFQLTTNVAMCSYGFYHGFVETLLLTTKDPKKAVNFCTYADSKLKESIRDAASQCYHGIGHGSVEVHDPSTSLDAYTLTKKALTICNNVSTNKIQLQDCATGIFNGIANMYLEGKYIDDDTFAICRKQNITYQPPCFGFMSRVFLKKHNTDFNKAVLASEKEIDNAFKETVISNLAVMYVMNLHDDNRVTLLKDICRQTSHDIRSACIKGISEGLIQSGKPQREHEDALSYCTLLHTFQDSDTCFKTTFAYIKRFLPTTKINNICSKRDNRYNTYCAG